VGTRGSKLSLAQTDTIIAKLQQTDSRLTFEKRIIATKGDIDKNTPLFRLDQKGIFEKEVNQAILDGQVDFAVHSMKDLPVYEEDTGLAITGVPERGSAADVLVSREDRILEELKPGSVVGTSSLLRIAQLKRVRPDLNTEPIRGNVETRILKVERGDYDAVVLAEAGLDRLGLKSRISERLPLADFLPAPGQGIISPVAKRSARVVIEILERIEHSPTRAAGDAERELVRVLEGGCKVPIGALAVAGEGKLQVMGCVLSVDGKKRLEAESSGDVKDAISIGGEVARELIHQGAKGLEEGWRELLR
jgi:hydroxymethylbilane synthase